MGPNAKHVAGPPPIMWGHPYSDATVFMLERENMIKI